MNKDNLFVKIVPLKVMCVCACVRMCVWKLLWGTKDSTFDQRDQNINIVRLKYLTFQHKKCNWKYTYSFVLFV